MNKTRRTLPSGTGLQRIGWAVALLVSGCAAPEVGVVPRPLLTPPQPAADQQSQSLEVKAQAERRTMVSAVPVIPKPESLSSVKPGSPTAKAGEVADLTLAFDQLPLPNFVQVVFGQVMKKNFSLDPSLISRTDLVTLRTGQPQTPSQVLETTRLLLKSYGVAVQDMGGDFYRIVPDSNQSGYLPEIRRGRAQPDVPLPMRPVFQLVELSAVRYSEVGNWLKAMFGTRLNVQDDSSRNALLISGQGPEVAAAIEAIQVLDQPLMRGRNSRLLTPSSLSADDMARRLVEVLNAEGYAAGQGINQVLPISLVPVPASGALLVFTADPAVLAHVIEWAQKLDALDDTNRRAGGTYFSYEVKYADAQSLAKTLQELMGGASAAPAPSTGNAQIVIGAPKQPARIVVNAATNTLIFTSQNPEDQAQLLGLVRALDRPVKSAMIEVTVAEVRVLDKDQLGLEWSGSKGVGDGARIIAGTDGGLSLGNSGLTASYFNHLGVLRAKLNALASTNKARILSTPRVMARNGEAATIQVGEEVPIITSQQSLNSATTSSATSTGVLQTVQYRNTGVILKVKPIIFAGRVELEVQQEVSEAASTTTGVNVSPTFSTRKIDTKVSISDGATVALGGLIKRTEGKGDAGVPLLKDIPGIGHFFKTQTRDLNETELIILITPYVVENDMVAEQVTRALRGQMGPWAQQADGPAPLQKIRPALLQPVRPEAAEAPSQSTEPVREAAPKEPAVAEQIKGGKPAQALTFKPPVGGKPVTDPALLDELRRAGAAVLPSKAASKPSSKAE